MPLNYTTPNPPRPPPYTAQPPCTPCIRSPVFSNLHRFENTNTHLTPPANPTVPPHHTPEPLPQNAPPNALAASALGQSVYSGNIVGYTKLSLTANLMDATGMQFTEVGANENVSIQKVLPISGFQNGRDSIKLWDPENREYITVRYWNQTYDAVTDDPMGSGWGDGDQVRAEDTIIAGQGFWLQTAANAVCLTLGEVVGTNKNETTLVGNQMDLLCNPFPAKISIQDVSPVSGFQNGRDTIKFWDPQDREYTTVRYWNQTYDAITDDPMGPGWGDGDQVRADDMIDVGQGFWIQAAANAVVKFKVPVALVE